MGSSEKGLSATMSSKDLSAMLAASADDEEPDAQEQSAEPTDQMRDEPVEESK